MKGLNYKIETPISLHYYWNAFFPDYCSEPTACMRIYLSVFQQQYPDSNLFSCTVTCYRCWCTIEIKLHSSIQPLFHRNYHRVADNWNITANISYLWQPQCRMSVMSTAGLWALVLFDNISFNCYCTVFWISIKFPTMAICRRKAYKSKPFRLILRWLLGH
jgi:hypothetical protein